MVVGTPSAIDIVLIVVVIGMCVAGLAELVNEIADTHYDSHFTEHRAFGINSSGNVGLIKKVPALHPLSILLALSIAMIGAMLACRANTAFGVVVILAQLLAVFYSAPPLRLKRYAFGGFVSRILGYGVIAVTAGALVANASISVDILVAGMAIGVVVGGFSTTADIADRSTDSQNSINTLATVLGPQKTGYVVSLAVALGFSVLIGRTVWLGNVAIFHLLIIGLVIASVVACLGYLLANPEDEIRASKVHILGVILESVTPVVFLSV